MHATKNEAAGFIAYSVEDAASAINRYGNQNGSAPISVTMVQEGEGSSATIKAIAVFTPMPVVQPMEATATPQQAQSAQGEDDSWGDDEGARPAR